MSSNKEPSDSAEPKDQLDPEGPDSDSSGSESATTDDTVSLDKDAADAAETDAGATPRELSNTERREAAKRKLQERLDAEAQARKKRKIIISAVSAAVVVAIVGTATYFIVDKIQTDRFNAAHEDCTYTDLSNELRTVPVKPPQGVDPSQYALYDSYQKQTNEAVRLGQKNLRSSPKPDDKQLNSGTVAAVFTTNQGAIPVTLDRKSAPCNTGAMISLIDNGFYNNTPCHRMTGSEALKVLQCGDPTGTGQSGPGWASPDELPTDLQPPANNPYGGQQGGPVVYPRGTIAIANSNNEQQGTSNTGSSQFFFVIADSQLAPNYTVVGKVDEAGLAVLDKIYRGGIIPGPTGQAEDGRPKLPVTIENASTD